MTITIELKTFIVIVAKPKTFIIITVKSPYFIELSREFDRTYIIHALIIKSCLIDHKPLNIIISLCSS